MSPNLATPPQPQLPEVDAVAGFGPPEPALIATAHAALAASRKRVLFVKHGGESYVVKRAAHRPRSFVQALLLRWLVKRVCGHTLPMHTLRLSHSSSGVAFEARRLGALASVGVRVPRVVHQGADYLLLEHCGSTVAELLRRWTADVTRQELASLANRLGAFHRAGQWHGAAQIKNVTRRHGLEYRIDFEEDFGERVPLAAAQALDLVLFLNSISLRSRVDEAEARRLLPELLDTYFASNPDRQVAAMLSRALPWATPMARLAARIMRLQFGGRRHNGVTRLVVLVEVLSAHVALNSPALEAFGPTNL